MPANRVLVICDEDELSGYLRGPLMVEGGHSVTVKTNSSQALELFKQDIFDIVIVRNGMFDLPTSELIKDLKKVDPDSIIIVYLAEEDQKVIADLLRIGVYEFIIKPVNFEKLLFIIQKGAQLHALASAGRKLNQSLKEQNTSLEKQNIVLARRIEESTKNLTRLYEDLRSTYMHTIKVLAQAIDARDHYTHSHSENVAKYAVEIANELKLSVKDIEIIREACELHDVGKIGVGDDVLSKPSSLTPEEWEEIRKHPITGAKILEPLTFLNGVIDLVRQHHEHYDGTGYPEGRKGEEIMIGARIINVADSYEAMRSARSYRKTPLSKEDAIREIKKNSGTQFDPKVVEAFLRVVDRL